MADIRGEIDELWKKVERLEKELKLLSEAVDGKFKEAIRYSIACSSAIAAHMEFLIAFAESLGAMKAGQREEELMEFLKKAKEAHDKIFEPLKRIDEDLAKFFSEIYLQTISILPILRVWREVGG